MQDQSVSGERFSKSSNLETENMRSDSGSGEFPRTFLSTVRTLIWKTYNDHPSSILRSKTLLVSPGLLFLDELGNFMMFEEKLRPAIWKNNENLSEETFLCASVSPQNQATFRQTY